MIGYLFMMAIVIAVAIYVGYIIGIQSEGKKSSLIIERQKNNFRERVQELEEELASMYRAFNEATSNKEIVEKKLKAEQSKVSSGRALINKLEGKLDDLVGDTAHLIDEAVDAAKDVVEDVVEAVKPKKKRKYTRKRKPVAKK